MNVAVRRVQHSERFGQLAALADRLQPELADQVLGEVRPAGRGDRPLEPVGEPAPRAGGRPSCRLASGRRQDRQAGPLIRAWSVDMGPNLPADQGVVRVDVVPLRPKTASIWRISASRTLAIGAGRCRRASIDVCRERRGGRGRARRAASNGLEERARRSASGRDRRSSG